MIHLDGYELIIGSSIDPQFGPVILFGSGGQLVEVYRDGALALPPLNTTLARWADGADADLSGPEGGARPRTGGPGLPRAAPGAVQPIGRRTAVN